MTERITWVKSTGLGASGWLGKVGTRRLFTIQRSVSRTHGWVLRTQLPLRIKADLDLNNDADVLKDLAERLLVRFVTSLGASFDQGS